VFMRISYKIYLLIWIYYVHLKF